MRLSVEQKKALAAMLDSHEGATLLHERISMHARLLLSELVFTLHMDSTPPKPSPSADAPPPSPPPPPSPLPSMQFYIANVGVHLGLEHESTLADLYFQTIRLDAITPGTPPVPLISHLPTSALAERRPSARPTRIPLEVDTTAAFTAAGHVELLPALCARSDSAHGTSSWQLGIRWYSQPRLAPAAPASYQLLPTAYCPLPTSYFLQVQPASARVGRHGCRRRRCRRRRPCRSFFPCHHCQYRRQCRARRLLPFLLAASAADDAGRPTSLGSSFLPPPALRASAPVALVPAACHPRKSRGRHARPPLGPIDRREAPRGGPRRPAVHATTDLATTEPSITDLASRPSAEGERRAG